MGIVRYRERNHQRNRTCHRGVSGNDDHLGNVRQHLREHDSDSAIAPGGSDLGVDCSYAGEPINQHRSHATIHRDGNIF